MKKLFGDIVSEEQCINEFKALINLNCQFTVEDPYGGGVDFFRYAVFAESKYTFSTRNWATVKIRKGSIDDDLCAEYASISQCNGVPGCETLLDVDNAFLECKECEAHIRSCNNYDEAECVIDDRCHFGPCYWDDVSEGCIRAY